jgi:hypothetical protein
VQASGLVVLLEPYHRSLGKRIFKSPKLYFTDTGLAAFLMGFATSEALWQSQQAGSLFENFVVSQWIRWRDWNQPSAALWFWRNQSNSEVDLVVEFEGRLTPIEIKLSERPRVSDLNGIRAFRDFYAGHETVGPGWVACTALDRFDIDSTTTAVPGWVPWELSQ